MAVDHYLWLFPIEKSIFKPNHASARREHVWREFQAIETPAHNQCQGHFGQQRGCITLGIREAYMGKRQGWLYREYPYWTKFPSLRRECFFRR